MAAMIQCDCCGKIVKHTDAMHLRVHKLADTTNFMNKTEEWFDVCNKCYSKIKNVIKTGGNEDAN